MNDLREYFHQRKRYLRAEIIKAKENHSPYSKGNNIYSLRAGQLEQLGIIEFLLYKSPQEYVDKVAKEYKEQADALEGEVSETKGC